MKKFYKVMASFGLGMMLLGFLFSIVALYGGAVEYADDNGVIHMGQHIQIPVSWTAFHKSEHTSHKKPIATPSEPAISMPDAIASATLGEITGTNWDGSNTIRKLEVELVAGEFVLQQGDNFAVEASTSARSSVTSKVESGVWKIKTTQKNNIKQREGVVTITIPYDYDLEELELDLAAGSITVNDITAQQANIVVGAGEIDFTGCTLANAEFECAMGQLTFEGTLTGRGTINCGMGQIDIFSTGNAADYGYGLECGMGSVDILGHSYSGIGHETSINVNAPNYFDIECGMGNVSFHVDEE
ncbi:MAG: DUF4097 family beta strand repeat-containing protein [Pygmaiobacter sp.]